MAKRARPDQPQNPLYPVTEAPDLQQLEAAVRAMQAAIAETAAANQSAGDSDAEIMWNDPNAVLPRPNLLGSKVWVHSPGRFVLPTEPTSLMLVAHKLRTGEEIKNVEYIKAGVQKGTSHVYLMVSDKNDPAARQCVHDPRGIDVNLSSLLVRAQIQVKSGYKELYPATLVTSGSMVNTLMVDMTKHEKRQRKTTAKGQTKPRTKRAKPDTPPGPTDQQD